MCRCNEEQLEVMPFQFEGGGASSAAEIGREKAIWIQTILNAEGENLAVDGVVGSLTRAAVKRFQARYRLRVDGVVGPQTETALTQAGLNQIRRASVLAVDGVKGAATTAEIRRFQAARGLIVDGVVGPQTRAAMVAVLRGGSVPPGGCAPQKARVRLHIKVLQSPDVSIDAMVRSMREVYEPAGFRVEVGSTERLSLPDLVDLDVGACVLGSVTDEQRRLFANRAHVVANDIAVYFVRSTDPPLNGCAAHPAGLPSAVVTQFATQWTMGHEVGHVLGLFHVNDNDRLMTGNGTANITNPPPDLAATEVAAMDASPLTVDC